LAKLEEEATRQADAIHLFEQAALQYIEDISEKSSADTIAMHLDQLLPFIGRLPLAHVHDGTIEPFIKHERARGLAPKSINNALGCVATILNRAARVWRDREGRPWLAQAPARISRLPVKGKQAKSYPLSWAEQNRLIKDMPRHLADPVLYGINTRCREQEICQLRWDWEVEIPELETSVFILPEEITKSTERVVILHAVAKRVIESRRGIHEDFVFTYCGHPMGKLNNTAWKRAWRKAGLPTRRVSAKACTTFVTRSVGACGVQGCRWKLARRCSAMPMATSRRTTRRRNSMSCDKLPRRSWTRVLRRHPR